MSSPLDRRDFLLGAAGLAIAGKTYRRGRDPRIAELAGLVSGPVIARGASGYDAARLVYNQRFDAVHPLAVVRVEDARDVQAAVRWAQRRGIAIVPRSGGHSYGGWSTGSGVVLDLTALHGLRVEGGTAVIAAGSRLIDVYGSLARRGATIPAGSCATVGIGGLALGGGIGLASRKLGTTSDNVVSLRIVTADGRLLTCDRKHNADLFWACRGGGGRNFGIVTDFRVKLSPATTASYFFATYPWSAGPTAIPAWQRWAPNAPDPLTTLCRLATGGSGPTLQVFGQYLGPESKLPALLAPLSPPTLKTGTSSYFDLMLRWAGCLGQSQAACHLVAQHGTLQRATFAAKSDYAAKPFSAGGVRVLQRGLETRQTSGHGSGSVIMDSYGGAIAAVPPSATAFVHRDVLHSMQYLAYWGAAEHERPSVAWLRGLHTAMRPHVTGAAYQNYPDPDLTDWRRAYYGSNYARLVAVKHRYDPDRLFRFPQAIG